MMEMKEQSSLQSNTNNNNNKNAVDGKRYDLCLVLDLKNNINNCVVLDLKNNINNCVYNIITKKLEEAGLNLYVYESSFEQNTGKGTCIGRIVTTIINKLSPSRPALKGSRVILIGSDVTKLKEFAAEIEFNMLLDAKELKKIVEAGYPPKKDVKKIVKPFKIPYPKEIRGEDIFLQTAIPRDRGCFPISCSGKKQLIGEESDLIPYERMYGKFVKQIDKDHPGLYHNVDPSISMETSRSPILEREMDQFGEQKTLKLTDPFGEQQRLKLTAMMFQKVIKSILRQEKDYIDEEIDKIRKATKSNMIGGREDVIEGIKSQLSQVYALHNREKVQKLTDMWLDKWSVMPWNQPFHEIRNYFGEKIAIYYVFVGHYCYWLLVPVIVGLPLQLTVWGIQIHRHINDDQLDDTLHSPYSNYFSPVFSFFIALWAVCMLEFWKRKEKSVSIEWGTVGCEDDEPDRPSFFGEQEITSFIDGQEGYQYYPSWKRNRKVASAATKVFFCLLCVVGIVSAIYYTQYVARKSPVFHCSGNLDDDTVRKKCFSIAQNIASFINAIQILIFNYFFPTYARIITERENNRTDTIFEDSLTIKIFIFQFVNSFASFYYLAFIAQFSEGCTPNKHTKLDCMEPLATNIGIIYFTRIVVSVAFDIVLPYFRHSNNSFKGADKLEVSGPEIEYYLIEYNTIDQSMKDYAAMALHFGYIALFIAALPLAGLLGFASALIEIKNSAWKLLSVCRRPVPISAEDIGVWQSIFLIIANLAVVTNAGITCFTMTVLNNDSWTPTFQLKIKLWVFIVFQWVCYVTQAAIMELIPDIPEQAIYHLKRNEHIVSKVIKRVDNNWLVSNHDVERSKNAVKDPDKVEPPVHEKPFEYYSRKTMYQPKRHPFIPIFNGPKDSKSS